MPPKQKDWQTNNSGVTVKMRKAPDWVGRLPKDAQDFWSPKHLTDSKPPSGGQCRHFAVLRIGGRRVNNSEIESPDIVWGAAAIAKVIGRSGRQAFYLLESGALPGRKLGGRWVASRQKLLDALIGDGEAQ